MPKEPSSAFSGPQPSSDAEAIDLEHFRKHTMQLFGHERGGHMARWVYLDIARGGDLHLGSELWSAFVDAAEQGDNRYYIPREEAALIQDPKTLQKLKEIFENAHRVIDFGSGNEFAVTQKTMPIVRGLSNVEVYTPFDISKLMLNKAEKVANDNLGPDTDIKVMPMHGDFSTGKAPSSKGDYLRFEEEDGENRLGLILGSTITNQEMNYDEEFPRAEIIGKLKTLRLLLTNGAKGRTPGEHGLIVGYDSNLDVDSASAAYDDPATPKLWAPLVTGVMFDIKRMIDPQPWNGGSKPFDPQAWHHERTHTTGPNMKDDEGNQVPSWIVLHQCVVADKDQDFRIENGQARRFQVKEGERFVIKNNFKFHPLFFRQLCREAGFNPRDAIMLEQELSTEEKPNTMVLQPLEVSY